MYLRGDSVRCFPLKKIMLYKFKMLSSSLSAIENPHTLSYGVKVMGFNFRITFAN